MAIDREALRAEHEYETWRRRGHHVCNDQCVLHTPDEHAEQKHEQQRQREHADRATHARSMSPQLAEWARDRGLEPWQDESIAEYGARCRQWMALRALEAQEHRAHDKHHAAHATNGVTRPHAPPARHHEHTRLSPQATDARVAVLRQQAAALTAEQEFSA